MYFYNIQKMTNKTSSVNSIFKLLKVLFTILLNVYLTFRRKVAQEMFRNLTTTKYNYFQTVFIINAILEKIKLVR